VLASASADTPGASSNPGSANQRERQFCTEAEALVIHSLLASIPERERIRILRTGLSPRTYETARARVLSMGWISERYVPDPRLWGFTSLRFDIATSNSGTRPNVGQARRADSILIHQIQGDGFALEVSAQCANDKREPPRVHEADTPGTRHWSLVASLDEPTIPIFFDYEGAWIRIMGVGSPLRYPRGMPSVEGFQVGSVSRHLARGLREAEKLVQQPFLERSKVASRSHLGPLLSRSGEREAQRLGLVERRSFLNPARLPGVKPWTLGHVAHLYGTLKDREIAQTLYHELVVEHGMTPFLFVASGRTVLIGALSPQPEPRRRETRTSVTDVFEKSMETLEFAITPANSFKTQLDHRYDSILGARFEQV
jgi:hypothetical protein